jgi:hypothetical protein
MNVVLVRQMRMARRAAITSSRDEDVKRAW